MTEFYRIRYPNRGRTPQMGSPDPQRGPWWVIVAAAIPIAVAMAFAVWRIEVQFSGKKPEATPSVKTPAASVAPAMVSRVEDKFLDLPAGVDCGPNYDDCPATAP